MVARQWGSERVRGISPLSNPEWVVSPVDGRCSTRRAVVVDRLRDRLRLEAELSRAGGRSPSVAEVDGCSVPTRRPERRRGAAPKSGSSACGSFIKRIRPDPVGSGKPRRSRCLLSVATTVSSVGRPAAPPAARRSFRDGHGGGPRLSRARPYASRAVDEQDRAVVVPEHLTCIPRAPRSFVPGANPRPASRYGAASRRASRA